MNDETKDSSLVFDKDVKYKSHARYVKTKNIYNPYEIGSQNTKSKDCKVIYINETNDLLDALNTVYTKINKISKNEFNNAYYEIKVKEPMNKLKKINDSISTILKKYESSQSKKTRTQADQPTVFDMSDLTAINTLISSLKKFIIEGKSGFENLSKQYNKDLKTFEKFRDDIYEQTFTLENNTNQHIFSDGAVDGKFKDRFKKIFNDDKADQYYESIVTYTSNDGEQFGKYSCKIWNGKSYGEAQIVGMKLGRGKVGKKSWDNIEFVLNDGKQTININDVCYENSADSISFIKPTKNIFIKKTKKPQKGGYDIKNILENAINECNKQESILNSLTF